MANTIKWARDELKLYLDWMIEEQDSWGSWFWWHDDYYANIIAYDTHRPFIRGRSESSEPENSKDA